MEQYAAASYCRYNDEITAGGRPLNCQNRKGLLERNVQGIFDDVDVCPWLENEPDRITTFEFLKSVLCFKAIMFS